METKSETLLGYCPNVLSLYEFIKLLGLKPNRTLIRRQMMTCVKYPVISLHEITQVLSYFNVASSVIRLKADLLGHLEQPFIANLVEPNGTNQFVVVKKISGDQIIQYIPDQGEIIQTYEDFVSKWNGVVVLAGAPENPTIAKNEEDIEQRDVKRYEAESINVIPDFFTPSECLDIIKFTEASNNYFESMTFDESGTAKVDASRSSYSVNLPSEGFDIYKSILSKVSKTLDVPVSHIEGLQCVRYREGQQFHPHLDSNHRLHRRHTILVYLNENFVGGETYFPELMLTISPKTGKALHFLNEDVNECVIPFSLHAGLPVRSGVKYACNIWVKSRPVTEEDF